MDEHVTVSEALNTLKIGRTYLYSLMNRGALSAVKIGKRTFVSKASLMAFMASLPRYPVK